MEWFKKLVKFIKDVAGDERIPDRDKTVVLALLALIISPIDLIPDWIPILGQLDDLVMLALVLDYLFQRLDQNILLSHYPWGMKSYIRLRGMARIIAFFTPNTLRDRIWKYKPDPYQKN